MEIVDLARGRSPDHRSRGRGTLLDIGCGDGRLASLLERGVNSIGADSSRAQLTSNRHQPVILADMRSLPFREEAFNEVTHLWCLYHLGDPAKAIGEARRVLRPGGRSYTSTAARDNDPEIMWEGYPPSTFDAEEALDIVGSVFEHVEVERWDDRFFPLQPREEVSVFTIARSTDE